MQIQADRITVKRLGRAVLRDVSISVQPGECVSIIGPNGAGKSTLMATLLGLLPTVSGAVMLDGKPIHQLARRSIARMVAYVPQIHDGYMGFRVREVIESGRYPYVDPFEPLSEQDHRAIDAAISATGVAPLLERIVETLSGGERQKVWIAAALAQQTPALFLDEPTNALDPAHQAELIRIMRRFSGEGNTLMVICHDLNLPMALGGRIIALRDGEVFFDESADVLCQTSRLESLFATPFLLHYSPDKSATSVQLQI